MLTAALAAALMLAACTGSAAASTSDLGKTSAATPHARIAKLERRARRACAGHRHSRACRRARARLRHARRQTRLAAKGGAARSTPVLVASGQTISWSRVGSVDAYVLATTVVGAATVYSTVSGLTATPPAVPGATVRYGVRADVSGGGWSNEVSITYAAPAPDPAPDPAPQPAPDPDPAPAGGLRVGLAGDWSSSSANITETTDVGAKLLRKELRSTGPATWIDTLFRDAATRGITILPLVNEALTPTGATAQDAYAQRFKALVARYGPGGSFWLANPTLNAALAPRVWEVLNEPYIGNAGPYDPGNYARLVQRVAQAVRPVNPQVRLTLAAATTYIGATNNGAEWIDAMYAAVPDLNLYFDVLAIHPYGHNPDTCDPAARWCFRQIEVIRKRFDAHGASAKRVWITEIGNNVGGTSPETEDAQAAYLKRYVDWSLAYGYVDALTYYRYRDYCNTAGDKECYFGVRRYDGTARPALQALRDMTALNP